MVFLYNIFWVERLKLLAAYPAGFRVEYFVDISVAIEYNQCCKVLFLEKL